MRRNDAIRATPPSPTPPPPPRTPQELVREAARRHIERGVGRAVDLLRANAKNRDMGAVVQARRGVCVERGLGAAELRLGGSRGG